MDLILDGDGALGDFLEKIDRFCRGSFFVEAGFV
jgi:hypothetical protein